MTLRQKQSKFARLVPRLIDFAYEQGYEITLGDALAHDGHIDGSFHYKKLAIDLNLFRDGRYLTSTKSHEPLGIYWESLDPECTWGGRFHNKDGGHYSYGEK